MYYRYDSSPNEFTKNQKEEWEKGYDVGYYDGVNRYKKRYWYEESTFYIIGYNTGYSTGFAQE